MPDLAGLRTIDDMETKTPRGPEQRLMQPGDVFAGRYEVQAVIGEGGMGVVYRAHDKLTEKDVALKLIRADRLAGHDPHPPTQVGGGAVGLDPVAPGARSHDVLPHVPPASTAGQHVVEAGRVRPAVGAPTTVTDEDRSPGQRHAPAMREPDVAPQPDHRGQRHDVRGRAGEPVGLLERLGLLGHHQDQGAPVGHHAERLERGVEDQRVRHPFLPVACEQCPMPTPPRARGIHQTVALRVVAP